MDAEFLQRHFFNLLRGSCDLGFCLCFCWRGVWHFCTCWTILVVLGLIWLGHCIWSFLCLAGFGLLICWEFLHLYSTKMNQTTTTYSSKILAYDFLCSVFDFGIREMVASQSVFRRVPSTSVFWKSLSRIGISFCMSGRILVWSHHILDFGL